ncbi:MAG: TonB-dependent receptor [Burkholderiaceae bacterium]
MLHAVGGTLLLSAQPTFAQQQLDRVEITGSSIRRIESETALPVTVITREEISRSGATTAAELLDRLSMNNGGGYNQSLAIGDAQRPGFAGASLRGLGPNTTLVLLNGRRLAVYAFDGGGTDLNSIAIGAIERIEILRDGASAVYGSDAIAGVMNFITRKDFIGFDATVSARRPQAAGGQSQHASFSAGFGEPANAGFNLFGNLTYDKFSAVKAKDRAFARTSYLPNAPGGVIDGTSGNTIPASITVPGTGTVNPGAPNCLPPFSFQTSPGGACRFDYAPVIDLVPPQEKIGGLLRGTLVLTPSHELFGEWNKTRTTSTFAIAPTPASAATTFNGDPVLYPAGGMWYPRAVNPATGLLENGVLWYDPATGAQTNFVPLAGDLDISWRTLDAGPRTSRSVADQERFVLGGKGTINEKWDYDAALMRSTSKATETFTKGTLSETRLLNSTCTDPTTGLPVTPCGPTTAGYAVGTLDPNINPFGLNNAAGLAALNSALVLQPTRISKSTRESVDAKVSGELLRLPAGPLAVAFGGERRKEKFDDQPLAILRSGDILGGGGNQEPVSADRNVHAVFGEVIAPVVKGLEALAQVRYDRYSDFGGTTNPKVGLRWQPAREVLVRGSVGTGFRAPTLPDLHAATTQTNTGGSYNDPYYEARVGDCYADGVDPTTGEPARVESANFNTAFCNAQLTVQQGGNKNLKPEKSRQETLGIAFQPTRDMSISVDLWRIRVKQQIALPNSDTRLGAFVSTLVTDPSAAYDATTATLTPAARAALNAGTATDPNVIQNAATGNLDFVRTLIENIGETVTRGVDIAVNTLLAKTEFGDLRGTLESTYIDSFKQDGVDYVGEYAQKFASFGPVVRWKNNFGLDLTRGPWNIGVVYRYQSGYKDSGGSRDVASYGLYDLAASFRGIKNLTIRAGVQNLLNTDPPFTRQEQYFQVGYDPTYADPRGRTFTLAVSYFFN